MTCATHKDVAASFVVTDMLDRFFTAPGSCATCQYALWQAGRLSGYTVTLGPATLGTAGRVQAVTGTVLATNYAEAVRILIARTVRQSS